VERRREPRLQTDQAVDVVILTDPPAPCRGIVLEISGRGLRLALPVDAALGTGVRVNVGDSLLLGEVCHHSPSPQGFMVGLVLKHSLTGLGELENLRRSLLAESSAHDASASATVSGGRQKRRG
jgi:hypothetical protein